MNWLSCGGCRIANADKMWPGTGDTLSAWQSVAITCRNPDLVPLG